MYFMIYRYPGSSMADTTAVYGHSFGLSACFKWGYEGTISLVEVGGRSAAVFCVTTVQVCDFCMCAHVRVCASSGVLMGRSERAGGLPAVRAEGERTRDAGALGR